MNGHRRVVGLSLFVALVLGAAVAAAAPTPSGDESPPGSATPCAQQPVQGAELSLEPPRVEVDMTYGGTTLVVHGRAPAGVRLAVRLMGERKQLEVNKKGKVGGILWMSVGDATFEQVPTVYRLATSTSLRELASPEQLASRSLGYDALMQQVGGDADIFAEVIKLKEHEGMFGVDERAVQATATSGQVVEFAATFSLPARLSPGDYSVQAFGFDRDCVLALGTTTLQVRLVGLARSMRQLALERGLLYGCGAVVAALVLGLLTGLIFGRKAGAGH